MRKKRVLSMTFLLGLAGISIFSACSSKKNSSEISSTFSSELPSDTELSSETSGGVVTASYSINADLSALDESYAISDTLYGLFLEDINYAVDGGLYAELIKNRSFEYGSAAANQNMHGWSNTDNSVLTFSVHDGSADSTSLNENNPHYAILENASPLSEASDLSGHAGISNKGYLDGLAVEAGKTYQVSLFIKGLNQYDGDVRVSLEGTDGTIYAESAISNITNSWSKYETTLVPDTSANQDLLFCVKIASGSVALDMISLMPEDTYANLPVRKDLGEYMEALNPTFLRFPGGCVIEGKDEESMYSWKDSIGNGLEFTINDVTTTGDVSVRPQGKDIWSGSTSEPYYTTYGLGFYEYFQLCEALDCLPVPVLNAGMTCEVQSPKYIVYGLSSDEFKQCVQDALDLVEFCLGGSDTKWGAIRIAMGHEAPFALKYIAIGNEQWQTEYHAHYEAFVEAFEAAADENPDLYGEIELIVANGTSSGSTEGWSYLEDYPDSVTTLVDEHYYESPNWFLTNTTRYDDYDRDSQAAVFLGEYAAQSNTLQAALAEAAYMTGLERNGDIVKMACYAPLFGNIKANQWTPDMMFFSNNSVFGSIDYYVQKIFSNNVGTTILPSELAFSSGTTEKALSGAAGLGSWMTSVAYDNISVVSNDTGDILYESSFDSNSTLKDDDWHISEGSWSIKDGKLIQANTSDPADTNTGDVIYIGDASWSNYTLTVDAEILSGNEGFLIPVCVENSANNIFWNIGGWGNTVSCLQIVDSGVKSGQVSGTVKNLTLKKNQSYQLKVELNGCNIKCYLDDVLYVDYDYESAASLYETASIDENGDLIVKFVNVSENDISIETSIDAIDMADYNGTAKLTVLSGEALTDTNSFKEPEAVIPVESTLPVSDTFTYLAPKYSVSIIRIEQN